jgi:DNA-binding IclR family transcriptional regulator
VNPSVPQRSSDLDHDDSGARSSGRKPAREQSVLVLGKTMALLDVLAGVREATAAELAGLVDEPRSSVYRLLNTLVDLDVVEPGTQRGTYRLGLKLLRLGSAVVARLDVRLAATPVMERIYDETQETVFLCLRRGRDAVCIARLDGLRAAVMELKLGGSLPLHTGAAPQALLAFDRRAAWDAYLDSGPLPRIVDHTEYRREEVVTMLEEARRNGVTISDEDLTPGFAAIGAPVYDHHGKVCASLSISGVRTAILGDQESRIRDLVLEGALEVSRALGYDRARQEPTP